jgi:hypothetical protein
VAKRIVLFLAAVTLAAVGLYLVGRGIGAQSIMQQGGGGVVIIAAITCLFFAAVDRD